MHSERQGIEIVLDQAKLSGSSYDLIPAPTSCIFVPHDGQLGHLPSNLCCRLLERVGALSLNLDDLSAYHSTSLRFDRQEESDATNTKAECDVVEIEVWR